MKVRSGHDISSTQSVLLHLTNGTSNFKFEVKNLVTVLANQFMYVKTHTLPREAGTLITLPS